MKVFNSRFSFAIDSPKEGATFKIDFGTLFETMCKIVTIDQATLLLYLLLHRNQRFYRFTMGHVNLQQLVIPILQTLYNAPDSTSHHIYMTLIVLLILSEDDGFNKSVHQIVSSPSDSIHLFLILIRCIVLYRIYAISIGTRNVPYRKYHWAAF